MEILDHPIALTSLAHVLVVLATGIRVLLRRSAPAATLAWLFLIVMLPFAGALIYLLIGERRISPARAHRIDALMASLGAQGGAIEWRQATRVDWSRHPGEAAGIGRLGAHLAGCPAISGSDLRLYSDTQEVLQAIARDIDGAEHGVTLAFYIWAEGGAADEVLEALVSAAQRGVTCRVLVDALGSRPWLRGRQPGRLRKAGVEVQPALPVSLLRSLLGRTDLRLHRKIAAVDDSVAWTGSMNLVDPRLFKQGAGVGQWVDAMVRVSGAAVAPLGATALGDWMLETGTPVEALARSAGLRGAAPRGSADVQVLPSGPGGHGGALLQVLLALINAADETLTITTPYLVPDESVMWALRVAAARGVHVKLIVPERVDSLFTRHASRSYFDDLLDAGIDIFLYRKGLLHTKSIAVDGAISMFGTVNLDMRSIWLNYEITLVVYDMDFSKQLRNLHRDYLANSRQLSPAEWAARPQTQRIVDDAFRLMSPLL